MLTFFKDAACCQAGFIWAAVFTTPHTSNVFLADFHPALVLEVKNREKCRVNV